MRYLDVWVWPLCDDDVMTFTHFLHYWSLEWEGPIIQSFDIFLVGMDMFWTHSEMTGAMRHINALLALDLQIIFVAAFVKI